MGEIVRGRFLVTRWGPPVGVVEDGEDAVTDLYRVWPEGAAPSRMAPLAQLIGELRPAARKPR